LIKQEYMCCNTGLEFSVRIDQYTSYVCTQPTRHL